MMHALLLLDEWHAWQAGVVTALRFDFREIMADIQLHDVDWDAWRPLYDEGRSPDAAVARAFMRDL